MNWEAFAFSGLTQKLMALTPTQAPVIQFNKLLIYV